MNFDSINWDELTKELIAFRRDRHRKPENGWTEFLTTSEIIKKLEGLNIPYIYGRDIHTKGERYGLPSEETLKACMERAISEGADASLIKNMEGGYTGVLAVIDTGRPGPVTAIRCDIDCNDVGESSDSDHFPAKENFLSTHKNLMHACGHDCHATIGIGTATVLSKCKDQLCGKIKIIFQPAEEGTRGAASVVDSGILDDVDYFFGGHMWGVGRHVGELALSTINESVSYKADLTFKGLASHAGMAPEKGNNALAAAASAILNMLAISRHSEGRTRINIGTCNAGTGRNVIPDHAFLQTEVRGLNEEVNDYMFNRMIKVGKAAADMYDCEFSYKIAGHSISAPCDEEMIAIAKKSAEMTEGFETLVPFNDMAGGGEDITFMMQRVQSHGGKATFMWIGADAAAPHHNSKFSVNEKVIPMSVQLYCNIVGNINGIK